MRDTVEIPMWCKQEGTDFTSASFTNRWLAGHVQRPTYLFIADEDLVTHGTDWIPIIDDPNIVRPPHQQALHGTTLRQAWNSRLVPVHFSIVPKSCHGGDRFDAFYLEGVSSPSLTTDLLAPFDVMLRAAHNERVNTPPIQIASIDFLGRKLPTQPSPPSLDPSFPALSHGDARTTRSNYNHGTQPNLLVEAPAFRRTGQGTWLGANESLKVKALPGEPRASIFVGSADGHVTRLQMQVINGKKPLVEMARSHIKEGGQPRPYALGYGTWGLDVGELEPGSSQLYVVAAAYDRIAVFRASDLELIRVERVPAQPQASSWEYSSPRRLKIAELDPLSPGKEIVFRTLHNHLVIMDRLLQIRFEHFEGGIIDFAIGPAPTPMVGNPLAAPIYLLSARGHLARLEIDRSRPLGQSGMLAGVSPLQYGGMHDLEVVNYQGQACLAGLFFPHPDGHHAVRLFSATDCTPVWGFGNLREPPPPPETGETPMSVKHGNVAGDVMPTFTAVAGHGDPRFVISAGGEISVWGGVDGAALGIKTLATLPPAAGHGNVEAGDIDEAEPGEEIVVATTAGRVVWFTLADLEGFDQSIGLPREFTSAPAPGGVVTHENRCNMSLSAATAIAPAQVSGPALDVVDLGGTWWRVDPITGNPTQVRELFLGATHLVPSVASSLTVGQSGIGVPAHRGWQTSPDVLATSPYVPDFRPNSAPGAWWVPQGAYRDLTLLVDGQWCFRSPGSGPTTYWDAATSTRWCAWWTNYGGYPHLLQRARYSVTGGQLAILDVWGSTGPALAGGVPPPRILPGSPGYHRPLRTEVASLAPFAFQAVRVGRVLVGRATPQVAASCLGGRVMLVDGDTGLVIETSAGSQQYVESADYGIGGMALATADLTGDGYDEVLFAPLYNPIPRAGGTVRSYLHVLTSNPAGTGLVELSTIPVGEIGPSAFLGYGTAAIAVEEILVGGNGPQKVIFVATLNGELAVFAHNQGLLDPSALFRTIVDGGLGNFGALLVRDVDGDGAKEVYVGGSGGLRRFNVQ